MLPKPLWELGVFRLSILENESGDVGDNAATSFSFASLVYAESVEIGIGGRFVSSLTDWPPFAAAEELGRRLPLDGEVRDDDRRLPNELLRSFGAAVAELLGRSLLPLLVPGLERFPVSLLDEKPL